MAAATGGNGGDGDGRGEECPVRSDDERTDHGRHRRKNARGIDIYTAAMSADVDGGA